MSGEKIGDLSGIFVENGLAEDGPGKYRGFLTVRATAENGDVLVGQLSPEEVRQMALQWLSSAEAADQDRIVMNMMVRDIGLKPAIAANFIIGMREERDRK
jgi:hypothetical protein